MTLTPEQLAESEAAMLLWQRSTKIVDDTDDKYYFISKMDEYKAHDLIMHHAPALIAAAMEAGTLRDQLAAERAAVAVLAEHYWQGVLCGYDRAWIAEQIASIPNPIARAAFSPWLLAQTTLPTSTARTSRSGEERAN